MPEKIPNYLFPKCPHKPFQKFINLSNLFSINNSKAPKWNLHFIHNVNVNRKQESRVMRTENVIYVRNLDFFIPFEKQINFYISHQCLWIITSDCRENPRMRIRICFFSHFTRLGWGRDQLTGGMFADSWGWGERRKWSLKLCNTEIAKRIPLKLTLFLF